MVLWTETQDPETAAKKKIQEIQLRIHVGVNLAEKLHVVLFVGVEDVFVEVLFFGRRRVFVLLEEDFVLRDVDAMLAEADLEVPLLVVLDCGFFVELEGSPEGLGLEEAVDGLLFPESQFEDVDYLVPVEVGEGARDVLLLEELLYLSILEQLIEMVFVDQLEDPLVIFVFFVVVILEVELKMDAEEKVHHDLDVPELVEQFHDFEEHLYLVRFLYLHVELGISLGLVFEAHLEPAVAQDAVEPYYRLQ